MKYEVVPYIGLFYIPDHLLAREGPSAQFFIIFWTNKSIATNMFFINNVTRL